MAFLLERRPERLPRVSGITKKEKAAAGLPQTTIFSSAENNPAVESVQVTNWPQISQFVRNSWVGMSDLINCQVSGT
jgi:hypothetical protein